MKKLFAITLTLVAFSSPLAHAAGICRAISKLPAEITVSGVYCLKGNLSFVDSVGASITSGTAIVISAPDTVLDLEGFTLSGGPAPTTTGAAGIVITQNNVTIRNGKLNNFSTGIQVSSYRSGVVVENMVLSDNKYIGMYLYATASVVQNNTIINTGGATRFSNQAGYGIWLDGDDITIYNNIINGVVSVGTGYASGIATSSVADRCIVSHNVISNVKSPSSFDSGIWFEAGTLNNIASDNRISNAGSYGIAFNNGGATGTYMNNLVDGSTIGDYAGSGTAAGSTNY